VDAATWCPATKHQDGYTRKEYIKFHTFWTSVLDESLTEIAPCTQWIGESINMVTRRKYKHVYEEKNLPLPRIKDQPSRSQPAGPYLGPHRQHTSFSHSVLYYSLNLKFNLPRAD